MERCDQMKKPKFPSPSSSLVDGGYESSEYTNTHKILANSMFMKAADVSCERERAYMSSDELYYLANSLTGLKSEKYQRALIDMIHLQCDDDSVYRFMQFLSDDFKESVMYSC